MSRRIEQPPTAVIARRRGFSLIELIIVITCSSGLMLVAVSLVTTTMQLQRMARHSAMQTQAASRLLELFRLDVQAGNALAAPSAESLEIRAHNNLVIRYRVSGSRLIRDEELPGGAHRREEVDFGAGTKCRVERLESPPAAAVTVVVDARLHGIPPHIERRVVALLERRPTIFFTEEPLP